MTIGRPRTPTIVRFMSKVDKNGPIHPVLGTPCHLWTGGLLKGGYGAFRDDPKASTRGAHRYSYILHVGPLRKGFQVLHKCDNPPCVNSDHLFAGTSQENNTDKVIKARHAFGERHGMHKLRADQIQAIRDLYEDGYNQHEIAKVFNVTNHTVCDITRGKTWKTS